MEKSPLIKYMLKTWATTILLSPVLFIVFDGVYQFVQYGTFLQHFAETLSSAGILLLIGLTTSMPILLIIVLLMFTVDKIQHIVLKKTSFAVILFLLICTALWIGLKDDMLHHPENNSRLAILFSPYLLVSMLSVALYSIEAKKAG